MDLYDHARNELALLFDASAREPAQPYNSIDKLHSQEIRAKRSSSGQLDTLYIERQREFRAEDKVFFRRYQQILLQLAELEDEFAEVARNLPATSAIAHQTVAAAGLDGDIAAEAIRTFSNAFALLVDVANSTYEGERLGLNIALDFDEELTRTIGESSGLTLAAYSDERWHRLLGANAGTAIVVTARGTLTEYFDATNTPGAAGAYPGAYEHLGRWVDAGSASTRSVLALTASGEILLLHGGKVRFIFRNGTWRSLVLRDFLPVDETIRVLGETFEPGVADQLEPAVVSAAIDASLAHHGATIAIVDAERFRSAGLIAEENPSWWRHSNIRRLLPSAQTFLAMSAQQRLELLSIDGATILDIRTGAILAVGAIVTQVAAGATGGGRAAATRALARFGVALKISQDGAIEVWQRTDGDSPADKVALVG